MEIRKKAILTDYLVAFFCLFIAVIILILENQTRQKYMNFVSINLLLFLILLISIRMDRERNFWHWVHLWFPLISCLFFYVEASTLDNLIFPNTFDSFLAKLDTQITGTPLYKILSPKINSALIDELMHAFYFSYYIILFLPALFIFLKDEEFFKRMIFGIVLMLYIHYFFFMIFPSDGPICMRDKLFGNGRIFIPIMKLIYRFGEQGGGAFPSTHVSASLMVYLFSRNFFRRRAWIVGIFTAGIFIATIYCSYHYTIDSLAGLITGFLFFKLANSLFDKYKNYF
ncbi:MAG: hypothetical protein DRP91_03130 [Candidatus Neomarinimicrobiota bacterium]|nr:MAG: hypothetical protein DRP91_03130 [Candidatus Neomarinimicrobiota bacterium]